MDSDLYSPMLPYRFIASWRAKLRNYPPRATRVMQSRLGQPLMTPPPVRDLEDGKYHAHLGEWKLVEKPNVRPYYIAFLELTHEDAPTIEQALIVDPYEANLETTALAAKIEKEMRHCLDLYREANEDATREL